MNAGRTGTRADRELALLIKELERLECGFRLEKERALTAGLKEMKFFRERCRTHYLIRLSEVSARTGQILHSAAGAGTLTDETKALAKRIEATVSNASARYSGTPNRLVRNMKSVEKEEE